MARFRCLSALLLLLCGLFGAAEDSVVAFNTPACANEPSYRAPLGPNPVASLYALLASSDDDHDHGGDVSHSAPLSGVDTDPSQESRGADRASIELALPTRPECSSCIALPRGPPATLHTA